MKKRSILFLLSFVFAQTKKEMNDYAKYVCLFYTNKQLTGKLITAMMHVESKHNIKAISHKGAHNVMQMTRSAAIDVISWNPDHCKRWTVAFIFINWKANIWAGVCYMNQQFINADGNITNALRMYNGGIKGYKKVKNYHVKVLKEMKK